MTDASGSVVASRSYDAWGNPEVGAEQPGYAFTGREWDPETGLYYYRARYYDPKLGRFISEDPAGSTVSLYAYVSNNPVNLVDPLGLFVWRDVAGFVPVLGSGLDAYAAFKCGNIGAGALHSGLAIIDATGAGALAKGLTVGAFKWSARAALGEVYKEGASLAYGNVRRRMLRRGLVSPGVDTHHWAVHQATNAPDWIKQHPANLMPDIPDTAHQLAHHGSLVDRLIYWTPTWAKAAAAGVGSYLTGLFANSNCECK